MKKNLFKLTAAALAAGLVFTTGYGLVQASDSYIPNTASSSITLEQAKEIALSKANLSSATFTKATFDKEDNDFDLEFYASEKEYECEVNASNGYIKDFDVELIANDIDDLDDHHDDWDDQHDDWDDHHDRWDD